MSKISVLYLSSIRAEKTFSGHIIMYRHLYERDDLDVMEYGDREFDLDGKESLYYRGLDCLREKFQNTRGYEFFCLMDCYLQTWWIPTGLKNQIRNFRPDVILTVAHGRLFWLAYLVSQKFRIPLVTLFHDWWPEFSFQPPRVKKILTKRMRRVHQYSRISLAVCEGMKEELGTHPDTRVLYPIPGHIRDRGDSLEYNIVSEKWRMVYAGNSCAYYGVQLQKLIYAMEEKGIDTDRFTIYTGNCDWPPEAQEKARSRGILRDFLPNDKLLPELRHYNLLLVIMGGGQSEIVRRTSFPCKTVDYLMTGKIVVSWGPKDSSVSKFISRHECGLVVNEENPSVLISKIEDLIKNKKKINSLSEKCSQVSKSILDENQIHHAFFQAISNSIKQ